MVINTPFVFGCVSKALAVNFVFIFVKMSNIVRQNENNLITTFSINEPNNKYVNINDIIIYDDFYNSVDYNSNYFAFITKQHIDNNTISYFVKNIINTNTDIMLLNVVRVPVQQYDRQTLINNINTSYVNSIWDIHKNVYLNESTIMFPTNENAISNALWYSYKHDNLIKADLNDYICYDMSNVDETNKAIDVSTINNTINYTTETYTMVLNKNREIYITNGDRSLYYNNGVHTLNNKYKLHITIPNSTLTEEDILENITTGITYNIHLTSESNTYDNNILWYLDNIQIKDNDTNAYSVSIHWDSIGSKYIQVVSCKDTDGNILSKQTLRLRNKLTANDIIFVSDYEQTISSLNLSETDSVYVQVDKNSCSFKSIAISEQYDNITIKQIGKNKFQFTTTEETLNDTDITFTIHDHFNNVITKTLTICKQPVTTDNLRLLVEHTDTHNEAYADVVNRADNTMAQTVFNVFSDDINNRFYDKIANGVVNIVVLDLPIIYMFGTDASNSGKYIVLKLNMNSFVYSIYSTSNEIITGNYKFTSSNNQYGVLMVNNTLEKVIKQNVKLITSYGDDKITFSEELLPVNITTNNHMRVNKRVNNNYWAYVNRTLFTITNNEITLMNADDDYYTNNLHYTSFGYVKHNTMSYLNAPTHTITMDDDTVFDYPVIYGNYFMQYIMKGNNTLTLSNEYKISNRQSFINNAFVKVLYSYVDDIDNIVNNTHDISNIYFNALSSFEITDTNKSEHKLNISKRVNLSKGKINIYIITNKLKWCISGKNNILTYSM